MIVHGLDQLDKINGADNAEFLKTQGYSDSEVVEIIKNQKAVDRSKISQTTCANSTPLARMFMVDSCFAVPMRCGEH